MSVMNLGILQPLSQLSKRIGIDLGTSRVRIWSDQDGIVVNEPACVAIERESSKVLAVGNEAEAMLGRLGKQVQVIFPLKAGAIQDQAVAEAMLRVFLQRILKTTLFFRPIVMVSIPSLLSEPERVALTETLFAVGFREVNFIDQVLAAAIGAGVPIADASGSLLLQLGAGIVEAGIISLSSLVAIKSTKEAGVAMDRELRQHVRSMYHIEIGQVTTEKMKAELLTLLDTQPRQIRVSGQDIVETVPKEVVISSDAFLPVLKPFVDEYVATLKSLFTHIPPELATDIIDKGVLLSGGLSQLQGLDSIFVDALGVPVSIVDDPEKSVILGIAQVLQNLELFRESTGYRYAAVQNG